jgi:hypothetical protein
MADSALDIYLNDHLAGAALGCELVATLESENEGTPLGDTLHVLRAKIEDDRETLVQLMERTSTEQSPVKVAGARVAEKVAKMKFSGATSGDEQLGTFLGLEGLSLGVEGKLSLWLSLKEVDLDLGLSDEQLDGLAQRARDQRSVLERERLESGKRALNGVSH